MSKQFNFVLQLARTMEESESICVIYLTESEEVYGVSFSCMSDADTMRNPLQRIDVSNDLYHYFEGIYETSFDVFPTVVATTVYVDCLNNEDLLRLKLTLRDDDNIVDLLDESGLDDYDDYVKFLEDYIDIESDEVYKDFVLNLVKEAGAFIREG